MGIYADAGLRKWFEAGYKKSGKKLRRRQELRPFQERSTIFRSR